MIESDASHKINPKFIGVMLCAVGMISWWAYTSFHKKPVISPLSEKQVQSKSILTFFQHKKDPKELADKIRHTINGTWKDYSVYVEDYHSDFTMGISETETFTAASINKVPILTALYYQNQKGEVNLDTIITLQQNEIQDYGSGSVRYDPPGTTYSVKTLARLMIKQSDNTAAYILANEIVGFDKVQSLINDWGMTQTDMTNNKTSNKDMALLFRKIYEEKIANHPFTLEMLSFLKDTDFETRLPANLPPGTIVYHKVGSETASIHDVGIVTNGKQTYYVGVFTNDETDDAATEQLIAKVSRIVYDYVQ